MHHGKVMHCEKSCIAENHALRKIMHRGNHASRVNNYARREDFIPRQNLCIARRLYTLPKFMHYKKNPGLVENHASRKIMHRGTQVNNYARREDFMPRQNLYITRRFHTSLKFRHREKNLYHVEIYASWEEFMPRWNFAHREKISCLAESYASREDSYLAGIYVSREDIHAPQEDVHG